MLDREHLMNEMSMSEHDFNYTGLALRRLAPPSCLAAPPIPACWALAATTCEWTWVRLGALRALRRVA